MSGFLSSIANGELVRGEYRTKRKGVAFAEVKKSSQQVGCSFDASLQTLHMLDVHFKAHMYADSLYRESAFLNVHKEMERQLREFVYGEVVNDLTNLHGSMLNEFGFSEESSKVCNEIGDIIKKLRGE